MKDFAEVTRNCVATLDPADGRVSARGRLPGDAPPPRHADVLFEGRGGGSDCDGGGGSADFASESSEEEFADDAGAWTGVDKAAALMQALRAAGAEPLEWKA